MDLVVAEPRQRRGADFALPHVPLRLLRQPHVLTQQRMHRNSAGTMCSFVPATRADEQVDPMVGVVPGGGGDRGVRFGGVLGARWAGGVGGVEVGVEGEGVVGVALQGSDAVVVVPARVSVMAWVSSGWGLISMKVAWC